MTATCELRMPSSYFLMDEDEMEYVEGGYCFKYKSISATQCSRAASVLEDVVIGGGLTALVKKLHWSVTVALVLCGYGAKYLNRAANRGGLVIYGWVNDYNNAWMGYSVSYAR